MSHVSWGDQACPPVSEASGYGNKVLFTPALASQGWCRWPAPTRLQLQTTLCANPEARAPLGWETEFESDCCGYQASTGSGGFIELKHDQLRVMFLPSKSFKERSSHVNTARVAQTILAQVSQSSNIADILTLRSWAKTFWLRSVLRRFIAFGHSWTSLWCCSKMVHLESHVATKTFQQIDRTVKTLIAPTGNAVNAQGQMSGFGNVPITLSGGTTPFSNDTMSVHDLMLWNPTGDGRGNISQLDTQGSFRTFALNDPSSWWHFGAGPVASTFACHASINSPIHDPDVRALYPQAPCRTTDAALCVDVNMGGGAATLRAAPFTKDMSNMSPLDLRNHIMADRHTVSVIDIGGGGKKDKRIVFHKWVQSRKAVGEFTVAKIPNPVTLANGTTQPEDEETSTGGMQAIYTDEFPYGGWIFMFENIAPATYGSVPYVRMASVVEIQVQLSLAENHLKETGRGIPLSVHLRDHEKISGNPPKPTIHAVTGSTVDAALKNKNKGQPSGKGKGSGGANAAQKKTGRNGRGTQPLPGPPGGKGRSNLRGSLSRGQQQAKSRAAQQNRAQTAAQAARAVKNAMGSGKGRGGNKLVDALITAFGGSPGPKRIALRQGL